MRKAGGGAVPPMKTGADMRFRRMAVVAGIVAGLCAAVGPVWACDSPPTSRYVIQNPLIGEVYDKKTRLTWERCSLGQRWENGVGCVGFVTVMPFDRAQMERYGGWRMPTRDELLSLVSPNCKSPAINDEVFPDVDMHKLVYWTSDEDNGCGADQNGKPVCAWYVNFFDGSSNYYYGNYRTYTHALRLVRDGQ